MQSKSTNEIAEALTAPCNSCKLVQRQKKKNFQEKQLSELLRAEGVRNLLPNK